MPDELDPRALWSLSYGLYIVTSAVGDRRSGQIANTVFQITSEPPRIAFALNKQNYTHELVSESGRLGVSVLGISTPLSLIGRFGFRSGREVDKFESVEFFEGVEHVPIVVQNAVSIFEARVFAQVDVGSHTLFAADVMSGKVLSIEEPLTYAEYHARKGRTPETAPSYRPPELERGEESREPRKGDVKMKRYVCGVCGYVYDPEEGDPDNGIEPGTPFEDLPDDWICPVCGASKEEFSPEE